MSDAQQPPPTTPLTVTLTVQQWTEALQAMSRGQVRKVGAIMAAIEQQCRAEMQRVGQTNGGGAP